MASQKIAQNDVENMGNDPLDQKWRHKNRFAMTSRV